MPHIVLLPAVQHCSLALLAVVRHAHSDTWIVPIVVFGVVLSSLAAILIFAAWREKKRTQAIEQIASGLGFEFFPTGDPEYQARVAGLELFSRGRQKKLWNLLRGTSHSFEVNIFDYSYVTGSGRSSRTWRQTIICLQSAALRLPDFALSPKSFWNMIGAIFAHTEIEIEGHPVFSKVYVLRGSDPEAIHRTFNDNVLGFFDEHLGLSSQGANDRLLLYRTSKRAEPDEIAGLLEDGLKLLASLHATG